MSPKALAKTRTRRAHHTTHYPRKAVHPLGPLSDPRGRHGKQKDREIHKVRVTPGEERSVIQRALKAAASTEAFFPDVTHRNRRAFLHAYLETASKRRACLLLGISEWTPYSPPWKRDETFQAALTQVEAAAADALEGELYRRAYEGVEKPVGFWKGEPSAYVREYSDILGIFLLKGMKPDKYKERVELKGLLGNLNWDALPHDAIDRIANGENPLAVLASLAERGAKQFGLLLPGKGNEKSLGEESPSPNGSSNMGTE